MTDRKALPPTETLRIPSPPRLHRATYRRLIREYNRLLAKLNNLPPRRLSSRTRTAYVRRALHLLTPRPPIRRWYGTGEAAFHLAISPKTLIRWTTKRLLRCERRPDFASQRYYAAAELARVRRRMKI